MKEHVQQTGVRPWAGEDLLELQSEPLKAIEGFFSEYGNCIVKGCDLAENEDNTFDISAGLIALSGLSVSGDPVFKVVPFSGIAGVILPVYFTLSYSVVDRVYLDNKVKPIAYDYRAAVSTVRPENGECLELTQAGAVRFKDVIQDEQHRFMTDAERVKLNNIEAGANNYIHPLTHPASMITEDSTHRFVTNAERVKLDNIEAGANNYIHPLTHPASMITEDSTHRFVTDEEITNWDSGVLEAAEEVTYYNTFKFKRYHRAALVCYTLEYNSTTLLTSVASVAKPNDPNSRGGVNIGPTSGISGIVWCDFDGYTLAKTSDLSSNPNVKIFRVYGL